MILIELLFHSQVQLLLFFFWPTGKDLPQEELIHTEAVFASNLEGKKTAPHFSESPSCLAAVVVDDNNDLPF